MPEYTEPAASRASRAGRFLCLQEPGRMVMVFGIVNTADVRRIYLDRPHLSNLLPTWNGHSIGSWDNDTFAIDTIGFNDKSWLFGGMEPHTPAPAGGRETKRAR